MGLWGLSRTRWGYQPTNIPFKGAPPCMFLPHATHCGKSLSIWQTETHRGCAEDKAAALPCRSLRWVDRNPSWTWEKKNHDIMIPKRIPWNTLTYYSVGMNIFQYWWIYWWILEFLLRIRHVISIVIPQWLPVFLESLAAASPAQQWNHKGLRSLTGSGHFLGASIASNHRSTGISYGISWGKSWDIVISHHVR